jgi:phosphoadenosine phosphosulfate reductase
MLQEITFFEKIDLEKEAIQFLKDNETGDGYCLAFSGGKDSIVIKRLADMAGVKYHAYYNVTTIDPPELISFIRKEYSDVAWNHPEKPLLVKMMEKGFPPLRQQRWCCELYKENGGTGRIITGVRREESAKRANRKAVEFCFRNKSKIYINPIINWTSRDVWEFIEKYNLTYCSLYNQGWERIGCLFCPAASRKNRLREVERYPAYVKLFIIYFQKLVDKRKAENKPFQKWETGEQLFQWWIDGKRKYQPDQQVLFE